MSVAATDMTYEDLRIVNGGYNLKNFLYVHTYIPRYKYQFHAAYLDYKKGIHL